MVSTFDTAIIFLFRYIQAFHFFSGPRGSPQEHQTRLDAGVFCEAVYPDSSGHLFPSVFLNQMHKNHLEGYAVKRVFVFIIDHKMPLFPVCKITRMCNLRTPRLTFMVPQRERDIGGVPLISSEVKRLTIFRYSL